ncbi:MAG: class I SAM-dependent methyltransferase [Pseudomonadota bacterium]
MDRAEFDKFAEEYRALHAANIRASGESPEFFAEYKIADIAARCHSAGLAPARILDFGGGTGASAPYLRHFFPEARLTIADVSEKSLDIARARGVEGLDCLAFDGRRLPFEQGTFEAGLAACVFHHIPEQAHGPLLAEIRRVLAPQGRFWIFEHNPLNPLTVRAVNTCPFDENALLIRANVLRQRMEAAGFTVARVAYRIFFPHALARLRPLEPWLTHIPFGAQYYVEATP